jgi:aminoglycoside phosphotransferase (APT) family kinase protein
VTLPIWHPEIVIDRAAARELIRSQFPSVDSSSIEPMGFGYDNTAFLVGGRYVFRFPRRTIAAGLIEREIAVLPSIAPMLPAAIPIPVFAGVATDSYPWPFAGYERIAGIPASALELTDQQRLALAPAIGRFLRALHAVEPSGSVRDALPGDLIGRLDPVRCLPLATERLAELELAGIVSDVEPFIEVLARNPPGVCERHTLVHGDLYARHVLLDDGMQLSGVIDWGDVHFGDPALDLAVVLTTLPHGARDSFEEFYGPVAQPVWNRARYRAIYHAVMVTEYGYTTGDAEMLRIGLRALNYLRASS